jgi:hypothetical protein
MNQNFVYLISFQPQKKIRWPIVINRFSDKEKRFAASSAVYHFIELLTILFDTYNWCINVTSHKVIKWVIGADENVSESIQSKVEVIESSA